MFGDARTGVSVGGFQESVILQTLAKFPPGAMEKEEADNSRKRSEREILSGLSFFRLSLLVPEHGKRGQSKPLIGISVQKVVFISHEIPEVSRFSITPEESPVLLIRQRGLQTWEEKNA